MALALRGLPVRCPPVSLRFSTSDLGLRSPDRSSFNSCIASLVSLALLVGLLALWYQPHLRHGWCRLAVALLEDRLNLRAEYGQVKLTVQQYASPARLRRQLRVIGDLDIPELHRGKRRVGSVWAISVVRDELDVLPYTVRHLLDQGVDRLLIADSGSVDGTREWLASTAMANPRVNWAADRQRAHWQSEKMTALAFCAWRAGADWVIPFDADEFWFAESRSVSEYLKSTDASMVYATFHHMVPESEISEQFAETRFVIDAESSFPGKVAVRTHPLLRIGPGNHSATRVGNSATGLHIAHAQYRTVAQLARKVRQGYQAALATGEDLSWFSPHWQKGAALSDELLREVWQNMQAGISDGRIDFRLRRPVRRVQPALWRFWDPAGVLASV